MSTAGLPLPRQLHGRIYPCAFEGCGKAIRLNVRMDQWEHVVPLAWTDAKHGAVLAPADTADRAVLHREWRENAESALLPRAYIPMNTVPSWIRTMAARIIRLLDELEETRAVLREVHKSGVLAGVGGELHEQVAHIAHEIEELDVGAGVDGGKRGRGAPDAGLGGVSEPAPTNNRGGEGDGDG